MIRKHSFKHSAVAALLLIIAFTFGLATANILWALGLFNHKAPIALASAMYVPGVNPSPLNFSLTASPSPLPVPSSTSPIQKRALTKSNFSIAIIGDSMVDTMGEELEYLKTALNAKYPQVHFKLYNYGVGAQTIFQGYERFDKSFNYKTREFPPIPELKPDILIIASFAYNPLYPFDRDKHWLQLGAFVERAREVTDNVYLLAEVAPTGSQFGLGAGETAGWSESQRLAHSSYINALLENTIGVGGAMDVPVINGYSPTVSESGFGNGTYTNPDDGIHPSVAGHKLIAQKIAEIIFSDH